MPEYMSVDRFQALPRSVPHQLFTSSPPAGMVSEPLSKDFQWRECIRAPADADPQIGEASTARRLVHADERGDEDLDFETPRRPPQRVSQRLR